MTADPGSDGEERSALLAELGGRTVFTRPGRFDFILPVGPPDADARRSNWSRYADEITDEPIEAFEADRERYARS